MPNEKLLTELKFSRNGFICCPQCGFECIHIKKTTFSLKDIEMMQIHSGLIEVKHEPTSSIGGYDYRINLHYLCESGCQGIITIWHHEGNTMLMHTPIK